MAAITLTPTYSITLTLASTETGVAVEFGDAPQALMLELAEIVVSGSGVSSPDLYAFAAAHG